LARFLSKIDKKSSYKKSVIKIKKSCKFHPNSNIFKIMDKLNRDTELKVEKMHNQIAVPTNKKNNLKEE